MLMEQLPDNRMAAEICILHLLCWCRGVHPSADPLDPNTTRAHTNLLSDFCSSGAVARQIYIKTGNLWVDAAKSC